MLDPPPYTLTTTKKELKQMYHDMVSIRYDVAVRYFSTVSDQFLP